MNFVFKKTSGLIAVGIFAVLTTLLLLTELIPSYSLYLMPKMALFLAASAFLCVGAGLLRSATSAVDHKAKITRSALWSVMGLYLLVLGSFLFWDKGFARTTDWANYAQAFANHLRHRTNFMPFYSIHQYATKSALRGVAAVNLLGNLLAFAPMGFLLPALARNLQKPWAFFVTMLCLLVLVETAQLLLVLGSCDIDDIILNIAGAAAVFALTKLPPLRKRLAAWGLMAA